MQSTTHGVTDVRPPEFSRAERARVLAMTAAGSVVIGYAAVAAVLALVASTATHASFSTTGVLTAAAPGWLVAHHVPLRFDGGQLGVLPLLPTALLMLLAARAAAGAADRLGLYEPLQARSVVLSIATAHAVVGGTIALLMGDGPVRATPAVAFFGCAAVSGVAATVGVARRCGLIEVVVDRIDPVARRGLRAGVMVLFALGGLGALLLTFGLVLSWSTASGLFAAAGPTFGVGVGMWLLCLAYLPNAVIGALSYLVGAGFSIGDVVMTPMRFVGGPVPSVPLLAALPERELSFLTVLLVLPLLLGMAVGWYCRKISDTPATRIRAVLIAAVTVGVGALVLAATAGGNLGGGVFNPVTVPAGLLAVLVMAWVAVPGAAVTWFAGVRPKREPRPEEPEFFDDVDEVEAEYDEDLDDEYADEDEAADEVDDDEDDVEDDEDEDDAEAEYEDLESDELDEEFDEDLEEEEDAAEDVEETVEEDDVDDDEPDEDAAEPDLKGKAE